MRLPKACVAAVAAAGLVLAASPAVGSSQPPVYTNADSGSTVHVASRTTFKLVLKTAADGGYFWSFSHRPDDAVVTLVSKHVRSKPGQIGGYAHTVYTFRAVGAGTTTETLIEHRARVDHGPEHFTLTEKVNG